MQTTKVDNLAPCNICNKYVSKSYSLNDLFVFFYWISLFFTLSSLFSIFIFLPIKSYKEEKCSISLAFSHDKNLSDPSIYSLFFNSNQYPLLLMAAVTSSLSYTALVAQFIERKFSFSSTRDDFRVRTSLSVNGLDVKVSRTGPKMVVKCMAIELPPVSETKANFLKAYKRPIPSIYNTVLQELLVQQHLMRYKKIYQYDAVFSLGFVTVYDQLMEGYPSDEDREAIFQAYIRALQEDPEKYRKDAQKMEEWARSQNPGSLIEFSSREGEVEGILKDIAARASGQGNFCYSRFFAVGLFRLLELANATEPTILEKLCTQLNIPKRSVDRDLDVYRNLLSKLVQAKELLREYVEREKKKLAERSESQKANEAVKNCLGENLYLTPMA